jgi:autotransporter adhesin
MNFYTLKHSGPDIDAAIDNVSTLVTDTETLANNLSNIKFEAGTGKNAVQQIGGNTASGLQSIALGKDTTAAGVAAISMGTGSIANGNNSIAAGNSIEVTKASKNLFDSSKMIFNPSM